MPAIPRHPCWRPIPQGQEHTQEQKQAWGQVLPWWMPMSCSPRRLHWHRSLHQGLLRALGYPLSPRELEWNAGEPLPVWAAISSGAGPGDGSGAGTGSPILVSSGVGWPAGAGARAGHHPGLQSGAEDESG